jgi:hypothetical protein
VERQIAEMDAGSPEIDWWRGALAGLRTVSGSGPFPTSSDDATSESYRGARFGGDLLASLIRDARVPSQTVRSICYRYGAALATPTGGKLLAEAPPINALKAHALGMHVLNARAGVAAIDEDLEMPLSPVLLEDRKRYVARRKTLD